jgi:glycosyltransferase involved in cell wall biosynthesis
MEPHRLSQLAVPLERLLLILYILLGPCVWAAFGWAVILGRRKMLLMVRPPHPITVSPLPTVTIFIPAKDEGERIRACLRSVLEQDYPNLRIVAIDDRSSDRTGAVMDEMAVADPRLEVLHITQPPEPGWTGKNNALFTAAKDAPGDWLLFVDSDVVLEKDALSVGMSVVLRKQFDLLSLLPRLESHGVWESLLVPLAGSAASALYLVALTNSGSYKGLPFANGQFLLISRGAYDAIGGHATVRDRFCEDVEMACLLKARGMRPRVSWGIDFAAVRMYDSLGNIVRGWSRIFYAARVGSPRLPLVGIAFLLLCCFSGYAALAWGLVRLIEPDGPAAFYYAFYWTVTSIIHLGLLTWFVGLMYAWCGNPRRNALLFPLGGSLLMVIFLRAIKLCITKKVEWRGTAYSHTMAQDLAAGPPTPAPSLPGGIRQ